MPLTLHPLEGVACRRISFLCVALSRTWWTWDVADGLCEDSSSVTCVAGASSARRGTGPQRNAPAIARRCTPVAATIKDKPDCKNWTAERTTAAKNSACC